jgi:hypothetical protein
MPMNEDNPVCDMLHDIPNLLSLNVRRSIADKVRKSRVRG